MRAWHTNRQMGRTLPRTILRRKWSSTHNWRSTAASTYAWNWCRANQRWARQSVRFAVYWKSPGGTMAYQQKCSNVAKPVYFLFSKVLLIKCWRESSVPRDMRDANIHMLYKNKGDKGDCNNYISLLSITGNLYARVVLWKLQKLADRIYPEAQCGFRWGRSTIDMIFSVRQLLEKCQEQQKTSVHSLRGSNQSVRHSQQVRSVQNPREKSAALYAYSALKYPCMKTCKAQSTSTVQPLLVSKSKRV